VTAAAAGWYHDPNDSGAWRWWDGATWTAHVRPMEQTASIPVAEPVSQPVAVQPVPQPVPQPVALPVSAPQPVIPQPAQPIQPMQPTSMTPETPPSEQEYWHSPNAEVVEVPGRSAMMQHAHTGSGSGSLSPYGMHDWGDVGSPQTAGIWLLAAMPLMSIGLGIVLGIVFGVIQGTTGATLSVPNLVFSVTSVVASWIFAGLDIRKLRERGYTPPAIWWMLLLPPLAYFIMRGRAVRREGMRAWPPELLYFLSVIGILAVLIVSAVAVYSMLGGLPASIA
jgi:hypothetical protein